MFIRPLFALAGLLLLPVATVCADESRMLADELANAPGRSEQDKARDVQRKPDQVLMFLGLRAGDTVLDIWSSGGWYTEVLSIAVGPEGKVYAQNSQAVLSFRDGYYDKALSARLAGGRLANVERVNAAVADMDLSPGSVDFAFTALNFHDVYNRQGKEAAAGFLAALVDAVVAESGFIVEARSDLLAHPEDDHTKGVFDPSLRGETDRFILRLRKPE